MIKLKLKFSFLGSLLKHLRYILTLRMGTWFIMFTKNATTHLFSCEARRWALSPSHTGVIFPFSLLKQSVFCVKRYWFHSDPMFCGILCPVITFRTELPSLQVNLLFCWSQWFSVKNVQAC